MNRFAFLLFLLPFFASAQQDLVEVEQLMKEGKFQTAFEQLEATDPQNEYPDYVIVKTQIALYYHAYTDQFREFEFVDLEEGQYLEEVRTKEFWKMPIKFAPDEALKRLIAMYPRDFRLQLWLGHVYYEAHQKFASDWVMDEMESLFKAESAYIQAYTNNIYDDQSLLVLGYIKLIEQQYEKSEEYLLEGLTLNPQNPKIHHQLAYLFMYQNQAEKSTTYAQNAFKLHKNPAQKADAARLAATMLIEQKDTLNAITYYRRANHVSPADFMTLIPLIKLETQTQDPRAKQSIETLWAIDPTSPRFCNEILTAYLEAHQPEKWLEFMEEKEKEHKGEEQVLGNLAFHSAQYYLAMQDTKKAKKEFLRAEKIFQKVLPEDHQVFRVLAKQIAKFED